MNSATYNLPALLPDEESVWNIIQLHPGRDRCIPARELARQVGLSERALRVVIHRLRAIHYCNIASATKDPSGYFYPVTEAESAENIARWRGFALRNLKAVYRQQKTSLRTFTRQLAADLEQELAPPACRGGIKGGVEDIL